LVDAAFDVNVAGFHTRYAQERKKKNRCHRDGCIKQNVQRLSIKE
jgi:hypothetical protein